MSVGIRPALVRLGDISLLLENCHVVADRGRRDIQVMPVDQRLGPDRFLRGDVVLDDGAQHLEFAVIERHRARTSALALGETERQVYVRRLG